MTVSLRRNADDQPEKPLEKAPQRDIYDIIARMLIGMVMNYIARRLRRRSELVRNRKNAARKALKLQKKGKEVPEDLRKESLAGLSRRKQKKMSLSEGEKVKGKALSSKDKKKSKKKNKKKKRGRFLWLVAIAIAVAVAVKAAGKK